MGTKGILEMSPSKSEDDGQRLTWRIVWERAGPTIIGLAIGLSIAGVLSVLLLEITNLKSRVDVLEIQQEERGNATEPRKIERFNGFTIRGEKA